MDRFRFASDPSGNLAGMLAGPQFAESEIVVNDAELRIVIGDPAAFQVHVPRSSIRSAERRPPLRGATRGLHGRRGRWLVNWSADNLVRMRIDPPASAQLSVKPEMMEGAKLPKGRFGKALMRRFLERTIVLRELTLSVEQPDAFVASLNAHGTTA